MKLTFDQWLRDVDAHMQAKCGMTHDDLDDWRYADAYAEGLSAKRAAAAAIRNAKQACGLE